MGGVSQLRWCHVKDRMMPVVTPPQPPGPKCICRNHHLPCSWDAGTGVFSAQMSFTGVALSKLPVCLALSWQLQGWARWPTRGAFVTSGGHPELSGRGLGRARRPPGHGVVWPECPPPRTAPSTNPQGPKTPPCCSDSHPPTPSPGSHCSLSPWFCLWSVSDTWTCPGDNPGRWPLCWAQ